MPARERRLPLLLAALALLVAVAHGVTGVGADALIAVPGLLVVIPLVAGRYVGSDGLVRLVVRRLPRSRHGRTPPSPPGRPGRASCRAAGASSPRRSPAAVLPRASSPADPRVSRRPRP
jgi:hypothetical protein